MAERRPCRALDHPQHRILLDAGEAGRLRRRRQDSRRGDVDRARLRQPGRRVPHHGHARPLRHPRHRGAELQPLRRASPHHGGGREAQVGVDGPQREQHPPPQRGRARRGGADRPQHLRDDREGDRQAPQGLAQLGPAGNLGLARPSGRQRLPVCRRLVQRRPALSDDARRRPHHRLDALHAAAQRQVGDRAALRLGRRLPDR